MTSSVQIEDLQHFSVFEGLSVGELERISTCGELRKLKKREVLFCAGDRDSFDYFLLSGSLRLTSADKKHRDIADEDAAAKNQIAKLRPRQYTVTSNAKSEVIVLPASAYQAGPGGTGSVASQELNLSGYGVDEVDSHEPEALTLSPIEEPNIVDIPAPQVQSGEPSMLQRIRQALDNDELTLPSLPQVAVRIGKLVDSEVVSAEAVAKLVNTDPAIATKLLRIANSSLYGSMGKCETTRAAIVRLGLEATRQLVLGFTLRDIFNSKDAELKARLRACWVESLEVAALAIVIRSMLESPTYSSEEALLAGLLHEIGVVGLLGLFLERPELREGSGDLDDVLKALQAEVGAEILQHWQFSEGYIEVARNSEKWDRQSVAETDLCDLIQVAKLHRALNNRIPLPIGRITDAPAIRRLPLKEEYSPEVSLEILKQAKLQILEIKSLFE